MKIKDYLGIERITQLENMGFSPENIKSLARAQYAKEQNEKRNELGKADLAAN